jgi:ureidoacrylate peracid hydrolase
VIVTGVTTSVCCDATARSAFSRDYNVVFLADATAECDDELHRATLRVMDLVFGRVMSTEELLAELRETTKL